VTTTQRQDAVTERFFDTLRRADVEEAVDLALGLIDDGTPADRVLLELVAPAQQQVGTLWQTGTWNVAQEHAATSVNEHVVAAIGGRTRVGRGRGHVVMSCMDGEWHALPARIVAEVMRLHGWRVTFLGASVPAAQLIAYLHEHGPDVAALSCALPAHLPAAARTAHAAQQTGTPVLAGGPGFGRDGRWARRIGVDRWAPDAVQAVAELARLPWTGSGAAPGRPARGGAEYAGLRSRRPELALAAAAYLHDMPGIAGTDDPDAVAGHVVDHLEAAVYVDDPALFGEFRAWTESVLRARDLPVDGLAAAVAELRALLHDFPRARAALDAPPGGRPR